MATEYHGIDYVPEGTTDPAAGLNISIRDIDALLQISVISFLGTPPGSPGEGDRYIVSSGTGAWAGHDDEMAVYRDSAWIFFDSIYYVFNLDDDNLYLKGSGTVGWFAIPVTITDSYRLPFGSGDLDSSGILTVTHGLGEQYILAAVYNASGISVDINGKVDVSAGVNSCDIDLSAESVGASGWIAVIKK